MNDTPKGKLSIRTLAMPKDTNGNGDIFGGWLLSQMDIAGFSVLRRYSPHRFTTVSIESMSFIAPVHVGDFVCCYSHIEQVGRTSVTVQVEAWVIREDDQVRQRVTQGLFKYVAINNQGKPTPVDREQILKDIEQ